LAVFVTFESRRWTIGAIIAAIITLSVLGKGVPALRHDWWFPADAGAMRSVVGWYADGWSPYGLGSVQPYPTFYPLSFLWRMGALLRLDGRIYPLPGLACIIFGTSLLAVLAGTSLCRGRPWYSTWTTGIVAAANPWVYNEYHAGHPYMVTAYAVVLALCAEIYREKPRASVLSFLAAFSILQIEFSALITVPFILWLLKHKRYRTLSVLLVFLLPIIIGIAASYGTIHGTPYGLDWQAAESIHLQDGLLMRGYRSDAVHFEPLQNIALVGLGVLSLWACCAFLRRKIEYVLVGAASICVIYASALSDFFGPWYVWLVLNCKESGLFRELYDVIAFVAIAYVFALAALARAKNSASMAAAVLASVMLLPWIMHPIYADAVSAAEIPSLALSNPAASSDQYRTLLLPAFQPLSYKGRGSGTDPNSFLVPGMPSPLNEWFPTFPVNAALAYAERDHAYSWAEALGVNEVIWRPDFATDRVATKGEGLTQSVEAVPRERDLHLKNANPLLSFVAAPAMVVSVGNTPGERAEFFGDRDPQLVEPFVPSLLTHDASKAWVDARFDIATHPEEASAFGGVVTASGELLHRPNRASVLGRAHGRLLDEFGDVIIASDAPQRWYRLPPNAHELRCEGRCMLALAGDVPSKLPEHAFTPLTDHKMIELRQYLPWFCTATVAPHSEGILRFNTRYDPYWLAFDGTHFLAHFRLDTAINAWQIAKIDIPQRLWLVHGISFMQAVFEGFALLWLLIVQAMYAGRNSGIFRKSSNDKNI
jgi:hypothetical protein